MDIKQRDRILEAIDQLRRRKARPDSPRICNYMMRRFNVDSKETKADLQKCVENEVVYKVEYKGDISYRNAAKWNNKHRSGEILDSSDKKVSGSFSKIVSLSVSELICQEPDFLELGVPGQALIKTIIAKSIVKYNKKHLAMLIQKEVDKGGLVKLENGHFSLGSNAIDTDKSDDDYTAEESLEIDNRYESTFAGKDDRKKFKEQHEKSSSSNNGQMGFRVGSRRKLAKKVFDPSDNNLPKRKRGRPIGSLNKPMVTSKKSPSRPSSVASTDANNSCSICHQVKKQYERMVSCRDCSNKVHLMCLSSNQSHSSWQCAQCKTCTVCFEPLENRLYLTCSACGNTYHNECHTPKMENWKTDQNQRQWQCFNCSTVKTENFDDKAGDDISGVHSELSMMSASPPVLSPQNRNNENSNCSSDYKMNTSNGAGSVDLHNESNEALDDSYDPNIPDASHWTSDDVYQYFNQFFPQEANIFKDQEIDGHSLLLMKRSDVLTSLNLKLGPALKIYRHVLKLQLRRDDIKLGWF